MTEYVHLTGTEAVSKAGWVMQAAGEQIARALSWHQEYLMGKEQRDEERLARFEAAIEKLIPVKPSTEEGT
jgi:hypothetical protein